MIPIARPEVKPGKNARPFGESASDYREWEWPGIIPVATHGAKAPLIPGVTGHLGQDLDDEQLLIIVRRYPWANIGLRLPWGIIGLDVDAYDGRAGAATIRNLERRLAPLPETWRSTSRMPEDGVSGIYLFRAPRRPESLWVADLGVGSGVEIIQWHHRFVTAPPSRHNETGRRYRWWYGSDRAEIPSPGDLPLLPVEWGRYLRSSKRYDRILTVSEPEAAQQWFLAVGGGKMCSLMKAASASAVSEIRLANQAGGLHDTMTRAVTHLCRNAAEGHRGLARALDALEAVFCSSSRRRGLRAEWLGAVAGAKRQASAREQVQRDPCRELRGINSTVIRNA